MFGIYNFAITAGNADHSQWSGIVLNRDDDRLKWNVAVKESLTHESNQVSPHARPIFGHKSVWEIDSTFKAIQGKQRKEGCGIVPPTIWDGPIVIAKKFRLWMVTRQVETGESIEDLKAESDDLLTDPAEFWIPLYQYDSHESQKNYETMGVAFRRIHPRWRFGGIGAWHDDESMESFLHWCDKHYKEETETFIGYDQWINRFVGAGNGKVMYYRVRLNGYGMPTQFSKIATDLEIPTRRTTLVDDETGEVELEYLRVV